VHLYELLPARARVRIVAGRVREGVDDALEVGRRFEAIGGTNPSVLPWRSTAAAGFTTLGETEQARRLAAAEADHARAWGTPRALAQALRMLGLATGGDEGIALLREAADVTVGSPALLERGYALAELGAALRRANRRAEGRQVLQDALDAAHRCGARYLEERVLRELRATGARPRRLAASGRDALTPSELRVAEMAAQGLTNREIAQRLFVTQKTVEAHMSRSLRKLGVDSRSQIAGALRNG
jgi:DNA-binding CsgD family transcriptional regulator